MSGLLPKSLDITPLLIEAKRQLHDEADYRREGACMMQFASLLADTDEFVVPVMHDDLTTENILAMTRLDGIAVEALGHLAQATRNRLVGQLFRLLFREIFEFRLIQTDPNFANYRYVAASQQLILLDFGATRAYPAAMVDSYRALMASAIRQDRHGMNTAAEAIGYFQHDIQEGQRQAVLNIFALACEPSATPVNMTLAAQTLAYAFATPAWCSAWTATSGTPRRPMHSSCTANWAAYTCWPQSSKQR